MNPGTCGPLKAPKKRLSIAIRTSLKDCEAFKVGEGSLAESFYLYVHLSPHTPVLVSWLKSIAEPAAVYFARDGSLLALQWRLPLSRYRAVFLAARRT